MLVSYASVLDLPPDERFDLRKTKKPSISETVEQRLQLLDLATYPELEQHHRASPTQPYSSHSDHCTQLDLDLA